MLACNSNDIVSVKLRVFEKKINGAVCDMLPIVVCIRIVIWIGLSQL